MSIPIAIEPGSPLEPMRDWSPEDLLRFSWRFADGCSVAALARVWAVGRDAVEALLAVPLVGHLVTDAREMLAEAGVSFAGKLRATSRSIIEGAMLDGLMPNVPAGFMAFLGALLKGGAEMFDGLIAAARARLRGQVAQEVPALTAPVAVPALPAPEPRCPSPEEIVRTTGLPMAVARELHRDITSGVVPPHAIEAVAAGFQARLANVSRALGRPT